MGLEQPKRHDHEAANDNRDVDAERAAVTQNLAEQQMRIYSVLRNSVSSEAWNKLGALSLADSYEAFGKGVDDLNVLTRQESGLAITPGEEAQEVGTLNFLRGWKLRVSRFQDGRMKYEAL